MFTKCPECNISFRVTAKVLQQANGNVRCGGCSHAFNALNYLSEEMPSSNSSVHSTVGNDELAETSRRLLQTLDELAGPEEVRIEDTGVEWRVLDKSDEGAGGDAINVTEEMRYDDSTLLPDDFGIEGDENYAPPETRRRESDNEPERTPEFDAAQQDLMLSEPDDWTDLLDEVREPEPEADLLEVEEELAAIHNQLSTREMSATEDLGPADSDAQFDTQAEAMGLDIISEENALTDQFPLLDEDAIGNAGETDECDEDDDDDGEPDAEVADDLGEEDATGEFPLGDVQDSFEDREADEDASLAAEEDEAVEDIVIDDAFEFESEDDSPTSNEDGAEDEDEDEDEELLSDSESTGEFEEKIDVAARALAGEEALDADEDELDAGEVLEAGDESSDEQDEDENVDLELEGETSEDIDSTEIEHIVPPPTEAELTVNQEIDQEMMAAAMQDDDFSATLVGLKSPEELFEENAEDVETIIMEGEFIRGSIDKERLAAEHAAKNQLDDPASLVDTYAMRRGKVRGGRRRYDPASYAVTAAIIVLIVMLAGQFVHYSRESLATMGLFNQTVAPVYRMLGSPVTPAWDIKGWQFEVTSGSVDDEETTLTIVSRIVNRAEQALPYPLVHVSLTDRWEENMGSRILEPGDYLAGDLDPSSPVLPGENFTAVITIENPSTEATGFKLNVCYRVSPGTVRCAIEDFKN